MEDANATIEKLNGTQIGGREIKVNITEKPLPQVDLSLLQAEDSQFVDSLHKVYVGNLAKTVTSETLKKFFFSEKGKIMSAKVLRVPGSSKSGGLGLYHSLQMRKLKLPSLLLTMLLCKYLMVASGGASVFILEVRPERVTKAWDHAAGMICVHEAGGKVTDWKGSELDLAADQVKRRIIYNAGGVLVTNGKIHQQIVEMISSSSTVVQH